jgi:hypothetical protein
MGAGLLETNGAAPTEPTANIIWVDREKKGEPPASVNVGNIFIGGLPSAGTQRAGFTVPQSHAALLCSCFNEYKIFDGKVAEPEDDSGPTEGGE